MKYLITIELFLEQLHQERAFYYEQKEEFCAELKRRKNERLTFSIAKSYKEVR